jgi:hypothetical protein
MEEVAVPKLAISNIVAPRNRQSLYWAPDSGGVKSILSGPQRIAKLTIAINSSKKLHRVKIGHIFTQKATYYHSLNVLAQETLILVHFDYKIIFGSLF